MTNCGMKFGCHNCTEFLWEARQQINQFLQEPAKELERMKLQMLALRKHIDLIIVDNYKEDNQ